MWTYVQSSGGLYTPEGAILSYGYSGAIGYKNQPLYEDIKDKGPIPQGVYEISAPQDTEKHGPYALPLTPDASNDMHGRSGFLIHGDSVSNPGTASEGCIIMPRFARERVWESEDHTLQVVKEPLTTA